MPLASGAAWARATEPDVRTARTTAEKTDTERIEIMGGLPRLEIVEIRGPEHPPLAVPSQPESARQASRGFTARVAAWQAINRSAGLSQRSSYQPASTNPASSWPPI